MSGHDNLLVEEISKLQNQVEALTKQVETLTVTTSRMDNHIDFVEGVYTVLRAPLDFIRKQYDKLVGGTIEGHLPNAPTEKEQKQIEEK